MPAPRRGRGAEPAEAGGGARPRSRGGARPGRAAGEPRVSPAAREPPAPHASISCSAGGPGESRGGSAHPAPPRPPAAPRAGDAGSYRLRPAPPRRRAHEGAPCRRGGWDTCRGGAGVGALGGSAGGERRGQNRGAAVRTTQPLSGDTESRGWDPMKMAEHAEQGLCGVPGVTCPVWSWHSHRPAHKHLPEQGTSLRLCPWPTGVLPPGPGWLRSSAGSPRGAGHPGCAGHPSGTGGAGASWVPTGVATTRARLPLMSKQSMELPVWVSMGVRLVTSPLTRLQE